MNGRYGLDRWKTKVMDMAPDRLHPLFLGAYKTVFPDWRSTIGSQSALSSFQAKHLSNTELVVDRTALLEQLPKHGVVAELGVDTGDFSNEIYSITSPSELYLVDAWASTRYNDAKMEYVLDRFSSEIEEGTVNVIRNLSDVALNEFDDGFFDWVYIDTTHSYEQTKTELEISRRKVKEGGFIAGHDYCVGNVEKGLSYGVIEAVHEFCAEYDWEITHLTLETSGYRSFALRSI